MTLSVFMYSKKKVLWFGLRCVRKPTFYICKNKGTDRLRDDSAPNKRPCLFTFLIGNFKLPAIFCGCTARIMSDLIGNPEDGFSRDRVQF